MTREVVITYLELPLEGVPAREPAFPAGFDLRRTMRPQPELNRFLYATVGAPWAWTDRLPWSDADWLRVIGQPGHETFVLFEGASIAGYFELEARGPVSIELAYFGLLPAYIGHGLGSPLLEAAIARAKARGAPALTVNTCDLDHPAALANYLARGFRRVRTETVRR